MAQKLLPVPVFTACSLSLTWSKMPQIFASKVQQLVEVIWH